MPHVQMPDSARSSPHTRRRFLVAAGTGVAVTAAGIWLAASPESPEPEDSLPDPDNPRGLTQYESRCTSVR
ncbi:twin-arginine translocation signal domain-containing protein [Microbacterium sp. NPDC087665]|uniref:twin-arginine translocation signal domain-containing protein n=1 Tax=Microbacterium sp. NPDC087665 TaxID=3364194 RepID=UPI0038035024